MGCLNLLKVIIGGWRYSIEIRAVPGYALAFWQVTLALKHRRGASTDAEMNLQRGRKDKKLRDDTPSARLFFIRQSEIANASPLLKDVESCNTRRRCRTRRLKTFHSFELPTRWIREKNEREIEWKRKIEKKREKGKHVHCPFALRDLGNGKWERGKEIIIAKRYRVPRVPKGNSLNLSLISEKTYYTKPEMHTYYHDYRWHIATVVRKSNTVSESWYYMRTVNERT